MAKDARKNLAEPITKRGAASLRRIPFLKQCKDAVLNMLVQRLSARFEAPGEILGRQGEECDKILLLGKGDVEVLTDGEKVAELGDGAVVGDPKALLGMASCQRWEHTVATTSFCDFMVLAQRDFMEVMSMHQAEARRIAAMVSSDEKPLPVLQTPKDQREATKKGLPHSGSMKADEKRSSSLRGMDGEPQSGTKAVENSDRANSPTLAKSGTRRLENADRANNPTLAKSGTRRLGNADRANNPTLAKSGTRRLENADRANGATVAKSGTLSMGGSTGNFRKIVTGMEALKFAQTMAEDFGRLLHVEAKMADQWDAPVRQGNLEEAPQELKEEEESVEKSILRKEALRREAASCLDSIDFFSSLDTFSFEKLMGVIEKRLWRRGEELLTEGKPASAMHVVHAGYVIVTLNGRQQTKLGPKSIVGERSVMSLRESKHLPCGATVCAASAIVVTMSASRYRLMELFDKDPSMLEHFENRFDLERTRRGCSSFKNIKLFENADPRFTQALEMQSKERSLEVGEFLLKQDVPSAEAVLLYSGSVNILKDSEVVVSMSVGQMQDAVIFGEFTVLGCWNAPKASIVATSLCKIQVITSDALRSCLDEFPDESLIFRQLVEARMEGISAQEAKSRPLTPSSTESESSSEDSEDELSEGDADLPQTRVRRGTGFFGKNAQKMSGLMKNQHKNATPESKKIEDGTNSDGSSADESESSDDREGLWTQDEEPDDAKSTTLKSLIRQGVAEQDKMVLPTGLHEVPEFQELPEEVVHCLESYMHRRLFMPGQVVLRQGMDMADVYILQRGKCSVEIFGADLEPMQGPSVIGGMPSVLTKKVFTTVIAQDTCFVGKISKRHFAAVFDKYHVHRQFLLASANRAFKKLCDDFNDNMLVTKGLHRQLAAMPFLAGASEAFLAALADVVDPRLLLPGQDVLTDPKSGDDEKDHSKEHHPDYQSHHDRQRHRRHHKPEMWFIFEGHLHYLQNDAVVGTISPKTVFGVLEVFGIIDTPKAARIKSDEVCKVGSVAQKHLHQLLARFPEEKSKFEKLVHNLMEDSVNVKMAKQPFFDSMPSHLISKVVYLLDRRFLLTDVTVIRAGDVGDFMVIMNSGKAELVYQGLQVSMLWPGKAFGASQMFGLHREYHATMRTTSTCHILLLFWKAFLTLVTSSADRDWLQTLRSRAEAIYDTEKETFVRRAREQRLLNKMGIVSSLRSALSMESATVTLANIVKAWQEIVRRSHQALYAAKLQEKPDSRMVETSNNFEKGEKKHAVNTEEFSVWMPAPPSQKAPHRIEFSRRLQRKELIFKDETRASLSKWKAEARFGRRDAWTGIMAPAWLRAVREEIPKQYMELKAQAKGGEMDHVRKP